MSESREGTLDVFSSTHWSQGNISGKRYLNRYKPGVSVGNARLRTIPPSWPYVAWQLRGRRNTTKAGLYVSQVDSATNHFYRSPMTTASDAQDETLHSSPAHRNARRPVRMRPQELTKAKSLPNLSSGRKSEHRRDFDVHQSKNEDGDDSLSTLEDPDDWSEAPSPPVGMQLIGLTKKDPKDCRVLLSRTQKNSLDLSASSNMSSSQAAPAAPVRQRSTLQTGTSNDDTALSAIARLQKLSMSAPNLRFNMEDQELDDLDDNNSRHNMTVLTPTRRRNPASEDIENRSTRSVNSTKSEPRLMLSRQQAGSFARRGGNLHFPRNRSASPRAPHRTASTDGYNLTASFRRRARIKVSMRVSPTPLAGVGTGDPKSKDLPVEKELQDIPRAVPSENRPGEKRPDNVSSSDSNERSSSSRSLLKRHVSRRQLLQKFAEAGIPPEEHEDMMFKLGFRVTDLRKSAEF